MLKHGNIMNSFLSMYIKADKHSERGNNMHNFSYKIWSSLVLGSVGVQYSDFTKGLAYGG